MSRTLHRLRTPGALAVLALWLGCAGYGPQTLVCRNDSDCPEQSVCFVDGCGDPGTNITLEVRPKGGAEQDYSVDPGELRAYQRIELFPTARVQGNVMRGLPDGGTEPYTTGVSLSARGSSLITPGVDRLAGPVTPDTNGNYALPIGSGEFTLTASTSDPNIPPIIRPYIYVNPGAQPRVDVLIPSTDELVRLGGQVFRTSSDGTLVQEPLQIEALDPLTRRPLSHRVPVADGGTFALTALPPAYGEQMLLRVTSGEANALVPQKEFTVLWNNDLPPLELGDFGQPFTATGVVVGPDARPVAGAAVVLSGAVAGGGEFRSAVATTGSDGRFSLVTLPSTLAGMKLLVIPPVPGVAGVLERTVIVTPLQADLKTITCPSRVRVRGTLVRPDHSPASGVQVTAEPVAKSGTAEHAGTSFEGRTNTDGTFELYLDPALYRVDFSPGESLPRVSRMVSVPATGSASPDPLDLEPMTLSAGRTLQGQVLMMEPGFATPVPAANATVRFFRLVSTDGTLGSVVLAQALTDYNGNFTVVLPTKQ